MFNNKNQPMYNILLSQKRTKIKIRNYNGHQSNYQRIYEQEP